MSTRNRLNMSRPSAPASRNAIASLAVRAEIGITLFATCIFFGVAQITAVEARAQTGTAQVDTSQAFSYVLPEGWSVMRVPQLPHDLILLPKIDDKNRTILITDESTGGTLRDLKQTYETELPKSLFNFKLIRSEIIEIRPGVEAVELLHTNTNPGIPVRQINYIVDVGEDRLFITGTVLRDDGDRYDAQVLSIVRSIRAMQPE